MEFSPEDGSRSDVEFMAEVIQIALDEGATTINVPDTVGYTMPHEYAEMFGRLYELVPGLRDVTVSVHCHDDLGLAVANSFAGLTAGARQVECAINGIGERAGNASLEEIVMLLHTRESSVGLWTGAVTREIARTSRLVSRLTGYAVQPNKAIVGRNAFAHEAGIHQDGVLKERTTYEIMDATTIGLDSNAIVLGKHSGRHALRNALEELGFEVDGAGLNAAFKSFKELADKKKTVTAVDLEAIVSDEMRQAPTAFELESFDVEASNVRAPLARVRVRLPGGEVESGSFTGDGPVDAFFSAINAAVGHDARLREFHVSAVTGGRDALGEVTVLLELNGALASGVGVSTDILEASGKAYLRALSTALAKAEQDWDARRPRRPRRISSASSARLPHPDHGGLHLARRRAARPLPPRRARGGGGPDRGSRPLRLRAPHDGACGGGRSGAGGGRRRRGPRPSGQGRRGVRGPARGRARIATWWPWEAVA